MKAGYPVPEVQVLFERLDKKVVEEETEKLERLYPSIRYVNKLVVHSWGQKVVRFYDLDGNLIEVGTPV